METATPIAEQPTSGDGDAQKPSSTTAPIFGGFTGTSFADLAKNSTTNSTSNNKSESFSFALTQNSSNGGIDQKSTAPVFGGLSGMSFADLAKNTDSNTTTTTNSNTANEPFGFAALAQNSSNGGTTPAFGQSPGTGKFIGLSNRDTFSNLMSPQNGTAGNDNNADDGNENATNDDANYDPHYDPIIALPDEIQVSTGEENEIKLFGERAKLYRFDFDTKEVSDRLICARVARFYLNNNYNFPLSRFFFSEFILDC